MPSLRAGQVVVMDNLGAHRPERIRESIEQQGCELLYLPAYSPDYNPIEEPSPRSRIYLARPRPGTKRLWWKRWARHYPPLPLQTSWASLSMPDIALRVTFCETCCDNRTNVVGEGNASWGTDVSLLRGVRRGVRRARNPLSPRGRLPPRARQAERAAWRARPASRALLGADLPSLVDGFVLHAGQ